MSDLPAPEPGPERTPGGRPDPRLGRLLERVLSQAVRTPLHSLLGFLELLAMSDLDVDQRRLLEQLLTSSEDLLAGSDRIIWLVRLLNEQYVPRPRRVDVAALVAEVAAASGVSVPVHAALGAPTHVHADLPALHQLLTELVTNALTHGAAPVSVTLSPVATGVSVRGAATGRATEPGQVRITLSDAGVGLTPEVQRLFLAPSQEAESRAETLGLLLVRHLAGLLGASVDLVPGATGTRVALVLPVREGMAVDERAARPTVGAPARPLRVLLVEDNATNRLLAERQVTRLGHVLTAVASGEAGVRAALEQDVDVVLMDRHLPDIDGCEATRRIRAAAPPSGPHLPIIAITADVTFEAREACHAAGIDEVLTKPVDLQHLAAALARAANGVYGNADSIRGRDAVGNSISAGDDAADAWVPTALRHVVARVDGDAEAAAELVATYLGELPGRRLRIQASLRRGEPRAVLAAAESLRTSSDTIGAAAVSGACAALGAAAGADDLSTARAFLSSLLLRCDQLHADLAAYTNAASISAALSSRQVTSSRP